MGINFIGKSKISHDKENSRVYLMSFHPDDFPNIIDAMDQIAEAYNYTKLFGKIPARFVPAFLQAGYLTEAIIPRLFNGSEDGFFMGKYKSTERLLPETKALKDFQSLLLKPVKVSLPPLEPSYTIEPLNVTHIPQILEIFTSIFETYPLPIFDSHFLEESILEDKNPYYGAWHKGKLVALCSAECNREAQNAELTDFAVLDSHKGKNLGAHLLHRLENHFFKNDIKTLFSISRLHSIPMNRIFQNAEYHYAGTLTRNTQICGAIESMNIWYKLI